MATYDGLFDTLGLREWCDQDAAEGGADKPMSMAELMARANAQNAETPWWDIPFPSLDNLNKSCDAIPRTRDMTSGVEQAFLNIKDGLKFVLDPLTQPLSWLLDYGLWFFTSMPWWVLIPLLLVATYYAARSIGVTVFVALTFLFFAFIDHYEYAVQTLTIIFICTMLSVAIGVPIGIAMSKSDSFQRGMIPVLDMLQTLPSFVYLIPLIFLFSVTEPKLYGIAIILYAIVPVIRLTMWMHT